MNLINEKLYIDLENYLDMESLMPLKIKSVIRLFYLD
jgi:hypothetical protein